MRKKFYTASLILALCVTTPAIAAPSTAEIAADESIVQEQLSDSDGAETPLTETESLEEGGIHAINEANAETTAETTEESTLETISEETIAPTENNEEVSGIHIIEDHQLDEEGRATIETQFPEDAVFPYQITLSGGEGEVDFTIEYNGQRLLIKPGTYQVKSVRDGNNKKLTKGARLVITEDTDAIYLDFNNPNANDNKSDIISFLITNLVFLLLAGAGLMGIKNYCDYMGLTNRRKND